MTIDISCKDLIVALNAYQKENGVVITHLCYNCPALVEYHWTEVDEYDEDGDIKTLSTRISSNSSKTVKMHEVAQIENLYVTVEGDSKLREVNLPMLIRSVKERSTLATIKRVHDKLEGKGHDHTIATFIRNELSMEISLGAVEGISENNDKVIIRMGGGTKYEIPSRQILSVYNVSLSGIDNLHNFT